MPPVASARDARSDTRAQCFLGTVLARAGAPAFGCYDQWADGPDWEWATPRQQNLFTVVRRGCADGHIAFGELRCEDGGMGFPFDQFMLRQWTGERNLTLPRATDMAAQDERCARSRTRALLR